MNSITLKIKAALFSETSPYLRWPKYHCIILVCKFVCYLSISLCLLKESTNVFRSKLFRSQSENVQENCRNQRTVYPIYHQISIQNTHMKLPFDKESWLWVSNLKHLLLFSWRFLKAVQIINILSKKTLMEPKCIIIVSKHLHHYLFYRTHLSVIPFFSIHVTFDALMCTLKRPIWLFVLGHLVGEFLKTAWIRRTCIGKICCSS